MEFLRFGSSIPGGYWGCCAMCIIQNFKYDPDEKASIQIVDGDGGLPIGDKFAGLTYREIFETRLRIGTFSSRDMPNHGFLAILTKWQVNSNLGKRWLKILRENGFEFIRTVDNSVYSGENLASDPLNSQSNNENYLFGLFRNIGCGAVQNPLEPPKAWSDLDSVGCKQAVDFLTPSQKKKVQESQAKLHRKAWDKIGEPKFYTRAQVEEARVPVTLAGQRSKFPQELAKVREQREETKKEPSKAAPFSVAQETKVSAAW